jgi:tetratricopeptide (TPR) repeat protein
LGDTFGIADVMYRSGEALSDMGDYAGAMARFEESLVLFRSVGTRYGVAYVLLNQGSSALGMAQLEQAKELTARSLALFREIGDRRCISNALMQLADVAREQRDYLQAFIQYRESLTAHWELNTRPNIARCLEAMAILARAQGLWDRAARLHGAASALRETMGSVMVPVDRARHNECVAAVRGQLGAETFMACEGEGRAMSLEHAVTYALETRSAGYAGTSRRLPAVGL